MKKNKEIKKIFNVKIIKTKKFEDHRGKFNKYFSSELYPFLKKENISIKEINHCFTKKKGTVRGMHFQTGSFKEDKIITCLKGRIFDVVVDLRKNSKNFLKYKSFILDEKINHSLFIPKGFAHGYQSITNNTEIIYFVTSSYMPKFEKGFNPNCSKLNIKWPITNKIISVKDKKLPYLKSNFKGL
jgi:dTDP-4-dehydrorhamnose 3,5-epimerase